MKKLFIFIFLLLGGLIMVSCTDSSGNSEPKKEYSEIIKDLKDVHIEVDETYTFYYLLKENKGVSISSSDNTFVKLENNVIKGLQKGETNLVLEKDGTKQLLKVVVHEKGELSSSFSFEKGRLAGKKIVAFGDSVTANATIGGGKTYFNIFAEKFGMIVGTNYAIGGTTATYMYPGSNIYKEYANSEVAIDGVRVVKKAYDNGELNDVDYVFIAYGHNDQYFQPPVTSALDENYDVNSFDSCYSFTGSYYYMINTLKLANPNVRIILLNCTYSEYDKSNPSRYGKTYSYGDYRLAISEIARVHNLTHIDPWDHMMLYFDVYDNKIYYKDPVHLSDMGHKILGEFICKYRVE